MSTGRYIRIARRALHLCGGLRPFCARMGVGEEIAEAWLQGSLSIGRDELLEIAEIIVDDDEAWAAQDRRTEPRFGALGETGHG
jgi:hypothetical protein